MEKTNGSNCFKRQEDGIIRSPLTIVLNIRDILTRSVFLIYIIIFIFIIHLITYEKGRNYIDGFKYRLCLQYCLSNPYFNNISLTNFVVNIYLLEGSHTLVKACITSKKYIIFFTGKPRASYFCHINAHLVISSYKTCSNCKTYSDTTDIFLFFIKINYMLVQELLAIYTYAHIIIILTIYSRVRWRQVDSLRQKIGTIRDVALVYSLL